jgi:hypothetical protein
MNKSRYRIAPSRIQTEDRHAIGQQPYGLFRLLFHPLRERGARAEGARGASYGRCL